MTRINIVDPCQLTDKHLMAEYRELPRIFTAIKKMENQGKSVDVSKISQYYVLGNGHVKFFYNKLLWLEKRYKALYWELKERGFNLDEEIYKNVQAGTRNIKQDRLFNDWTPIPEEIYLNMARLAKRSKISQVIEEIKSG